MYEIIKHYKVEKEKKDKNEFTIILSYIIDKIL